MAAIQTFAAIDVSSFEMELGIYEISQKNGIRAIDHVRHPIVLGRDVYNGGRSLMTLWTKCAGSWRIFPGL